MSTKPSGKSNTVEYVILGIVILVALVAAGYLIWQFAFQKNGNTTGETCSGNDDCAAKHYCGGDGRCHAGTAGGGAGTTCTDSADCMLGLTCTLNKCESGVTPPVNDLGSFTDSHIMLDHGSSTARYLTLIPEPSGDLGQAEWGTDIPDMTFAYSSSTNEITVAGSQSGQLMVNAGGFPQVGPAAKFFFVKDGTGKIRMEDGFGNIIQTMDSNVSGDPPIAIFNDPTRYIDQGTFTSTSTFITIVSATST